MAGGVAKEGQGGSPKAVGALIEAAGSLCENGRCCCRGETHVLSAQRTVFPCHKIQSYRPKTNEVAGQWWLPDS